MMMRVDDGADDVVVNYVVVYGVDDVDGVGGVDGDDVDYVCMLCMYE